jgi:hypothetical protein
MDMVAPKAAAKHEHLFNKQEAGLLDQNSRLPPAPAQGYQIHDSKRYDFGRTWLCHVSLT